MKPQNFDIELVIYLIVASWLFELLVVLLVTELCIIHNQLKHFSRIFLVWRSVAFDYYADIPPIYLKLDYPLNWWELHCDMFSAAP